MRQGWRPGLTRPRRYNLRGCLKTEYAPALGASMLGRTGRGVAAGPVPAAQGSVGNPATGSCFMSWRVARND